ncbi:MAG: TadE/TadG family type IV pilus assembly protein [Nocardioidaceae bacterium]
MTDHRSATGAASLELVILAPMLFAVLSLILVFGRYAETESLIDQAARDGARAATAQNSAIDAESIADGIVAEALADAPSSCRDSADVTFSKGPDAYEPPDLNDLTTVSWVAVEVSCTVDLTDLGPLPLQEVGITQTFTSPLDRYRGYEQ